MSAAIITVAVVLVVALAAGAVFYFMSSKSATLANGSSYPAGKNVKITNTSTKTFDSLFLVTSGGKMTRMTDSSGNDMTLTPNHSIVVAIPSNETSYTIISGVSNPLSIYCTVLVNRSNSLTICNNGPVILSFTVVTDTPTVFPEYVTTSYHSLGPLDLSGSVVLSNGSTFPTTLYLSNPVPDQNVSIYAFSNMSAQQIDLSGYSNGSSDTLSDNDKTIQLSSGSSSSAIPISVSSGGYWILLEPILIDANFCFTGIVLYNNNGKVNLFPIGQPVPLIYTSIATLSTIQRHSTTPAKVLATLPMMFRKK